MADINSTGASVGPAAASPGPAGPSLPEPRSQQFTHADLVACIELFYFAYRDFTCDPDAILAEYGFGRAHHRVLHFVHRHPGLRVAQLLEILKITKQSLSRVLKQLIDEGFIIQRTGNEDRRERRLYMSAKGGRLADKLTQIQMKRVEGALARLEPGAERVATNFLFAMIADKDRSQVENLIKGQHPETSSGSSGFKE